MCVGGFVRGAVHVSKCVRSVCGELCVSVWVCVSMHVCMDLHVHVV